MEIANEFNLKVLEDCAQAHGAKIDKMVALLEMLLPLAFIQVKKGHTETQV